MAKESLKHRIGPYRLYAPVYDRVFAPSFSEGHRKMYQSLDLEEGDSFSFPTTITHNARNVTDQPCQLIWSISPVTIPRDVVISESRHTASKKGQG